MNDFSFVVHTYGCKVNTYDSGLLQKRLTQEGFTLRADQPRIHILNTCAVTQEATKEAVRSIRRIKAKDPLATVVVTGCAAQVDTDFFSNLPGADLVVANSHKGQLESLLRKYFSGQLQDKVFKSNIFKKEDLEMGGGLEIEHTRSFLKIQDGCNSFCTYCVIPFARGKSRSIAINDLVQRVNELYDQGFREVVLTGVHIGDYQDVDKRLEDLVETLLLKTKMPRFRLSSLEPIELTDRLMALYKDNRLCPHFHMSIQSACTEILKRMKRHYEAKDVETALNRISKELSNAYVGMDVIVGFPGEDESHFFETYERLNSLPWTRIHVFPYSERPGTKALHLDQKVSANLIHANSRRLRELSGLREQAAAHRQVGTLQKVLRLKHSKEIQGLSRHYWNIQLDREIPFGEEFLVRVSDIKNEKLVGEVAG